MKHRLKGLLALVLSLVMVFATATSAWAAVRIGNVYISDVSTDTTYYYKNSDTHTATGTESDYNAMLWMDNGVLNLTLNNYVYEGSSGITAESDLTIHLIGNNTVTYSSSSGNASVFVNGNLTITSSDPSAKLTADFDSSIGYANGGGIEATNLTIEGGTVSAAAVGTNSHGIEATNAVSITGGTVTAEADEAGIYSTNSVSITGGTVTATASETNDSYGIYVDATDGFITISGENTKVEVGCATGLAATTVNILANSTVSIEAKNANNENAIISDTLNMGGNWYQWTDDSNSVQKSSDTNQLDATKAAATGTLIIEKIVQPPATYTVTFDTNGHGTAPATQTDIPKGEKITEPYPAPTEDGWTFGGWYTDDGAWTDKWDFAADTVEDNITLYAKWTENSSGGDSEQEPSHKYPIRIPDLEEESKVESPNTFDGGIASAVVVTILSATGGAWLAKKKD